MLMIRCTVNTHTVADAARKVAQPQQRLTALMPVAKMAVPAAMVHTMEFIVHDRAVTRLMH